MLLQDTATAWSQGSLLSQNMQKTRNNEVIKIRDKTIGKET